MPEALSVHLGKLAAERIAREGWNPSLFDLLVGASGGPKWFVLGQLDRVLFGEFLHAGSRPLTLLGSSIGSWRHACLAQDDPVAAIGRLESGYLNQTYSSAAPTAEEISEVSRAILADVLGAAGTRQIVEHDRLRTHIVTARGRGAAASRQNGLLAAAMGTAALGNTLSRRLLNLHFQRVVFHSDVSHAPMLHLKDFATIYCGLTEHNLKAALHASGSIPFVLTGERDIENAPPGQYWDGGIIDYHFDLQQYQGEGLILYPHFSDAIIPGWFDKFLPWRKTTPAAIDHLVLLCPSDAFIADLPQGKIPDRNDFKRMQPEERIAYWQVCIERSKALADDFAALLASSNPLAGVDVLN